MCFTLCEYQMDIKFDMLQPFQELHPALAAADYIYSLNHMCIARATEAEEHHTGTRHVIDFKTIGRL